MDRMWRLLRRRSLWMLLLLLALLAVTASVLAGGGEGLWTRRVVIGGGGGHVAAGRYALDSTIGQGVAGTVWSGGTELCAGFWCGTGVYELHLPAVMRP